MAAKSVKDKYPNIASVSVLSSAANTLTFQQLQSGISIFEKTAWEIYAVEYDIDAGDLDEMTATLDNVLFGLIRTDNSSSILYSDPALIDYVRLEHFFMGFTPATSKLLQFPIVRSFIEMFGSPLIVLPNPLYGFVKSTGLASALKVVIRIYYKQIILSPQDYVELIEATRIVS